MCCSIVRFSLNVRSPCSLFYRSLFIKYLGGIYYIFLSFLLVSGLFSCILFTNICDRQFVIFFTSDMQGLINHDIY